ncbi:MAG TPA: TadE family protein [Gemmataceae bacterium]|jgi:Flp pilus assembly protein TadG|nr:TadE family protein [Gemmataceae bacterium]
MCTARNGALTRQARRTVPRSAAIAAELAICLPFLTAMFLIAVDFCRVFYYAETIQNCAECAALYAGGVVNPNTGIDPTTAAQQAAVAEGSSLNPALQTGNVKVSITSSTATVTVTYQFQTIVPYPMLPGGITLTRTAQMPVIPATGQ